MARNTIGHSVHYIIYYTYLTLKYVIVLILSIVNTEQYYNETELLYCTFYYIEML
jgi:hypothetical protein